MGLVKREKVEHRPPCGTCVPGLVCVCSAAAHISFEVK